MSRTFWMRPILLGLIACMVPCIVPRVASGAEGGRTPAGNIVSVSGKVMIRQESGSASRDLRPALPGKEVWVGDIITTPSDGRIKLLLKDRSIMDIGPSSLFKLDQMKAGAGGQREVDATVAYGTLRAGVTQKLEGKSHFKVRTASATMGVRGTEFIVKSELGDMKQLNQVLSAKPGELPSLSGTMARGELPKTEVTVLQGKVEVGTPPPSPNGGTAASRSGQGSAPPAAAPAILSPGMQLVSGGVPPPQSPGVASGAPEVRQLDQQKLSEVATVARVQDKTFEQAATIQGTTRDEEAQAKREEKREERREASRSESRAPAGDTGASESRQAEGGSSGAKKDQRTASADTPATGAAPATPSDSARSPSSTTSASTTSASTSSGGSALTSGLGAITTAVTTNVQIAIQTTVQTVRVADAINSPLAANAAVTQRSATVPNVHTLTIQFTPPAP
jgi:hypothetical protein